LRSDRRRLNSRPYCFVSHTKPLDRPDLLTCLPTMTGQPRFRAHSASPPGPKETPSHSTGVTYNINWVPCSDFRIWGPRRRTGLDFALPALVGGANDPAHKSLPRCYLQSKSPPVNLCSRTIPNKNVKGYGRHMIFDRKCSITTASQANRIPLVKRS
jgi:hypothetical protein